MAAVNYICFFTPIETIFLYSLKLFEKTPTSLTDWDNKSQFGFSCSHLKFLPEVLKNASAARWSEPYMYKENRKQQQQQAETKELTWGLQIHVP